MNNEEYHTNKTKNKERKIKIYMKRGKHISEDEQEMQFYNSESEDLQKDYPIEQEDMVYDKTEGKMKYIQT